MGTKNDQQDPLTQALKQFARDQQEFENHGLWQHLKTTPKRFFNELHHYIKMRGISPQEWQEKLNDARKFIETRVQEQHRQYKAVDFKTYTGIKP